MSCYSSYDYLKVIALGELLREHRMPRAWRSSGDTTLSARPAGFTREEGSPFDFVVVDDGGRPLPRYRGVLGQRQARPSIASWAQTRSPAPATDAVPAGPWIAIGQSRDVWRPKRRSLYLSRGCPFDCAFCMERA
ncbi:MAG: hypothetical protein R3B07_29715 [Polyangiaceae bacterium]